MKYFQNQWGLIASLGLALLFLLGFGLKAEYQQSQGTRVFLEISGYDPRDLISGHYLRYQVHYHIANLPEARIATTQVPATTPKKPPCARGQECCLCLEVNAQSHLQRSEAYACEIKPDRELCPLFLKGKLEYGERFEAGIERYYIPEKHSQTWDQKLRQENGIIEVKIREDGHASLQNLRLGGTPRAEPTP